MKIFLVGADLRRRFDNVRHRDAVVIAKPRQQFVAHRNALFSPVNRLPIYAQFVRYLLLSFAEKLPSIGKFLVVVVP